MPASNHVLEHQRLTELGYDSIGSKRQGIIVDHGDPAKAHEKREASELKLLRDQIKIAKTIRAGADKNNMSIEQYAPLYWKWRRSQNQKIL
jgi:hypothetical protein